MATTRQMISDWFDRGVEEGHAYMIVVCDTWDYEDYPVYADSDGECMKEFQNHNGHNMQKVMEVYNLNMDKEEQLNTRLVFNLPK